MKRNRLITLPIILLILLALACGTSTNETTAPEEQNQPAQNAATGDENTPPAEEEPESPVAEDEPAAPEPTPKPTSTPQPTPNPNLISSGVYLVGSDIQPGLYRGQAGEGLFDSCYWERLSGLSGEFDDLISNDIASGQFYVEVMDTDQAFSVDCEVEYLEAPPEPVAEFPTAIAMGTYIVGVEIAPGLYRGEAGLDLFDSCYWERLSGFSGEFDDLITNDGAVGQFYVEVSDTDIGFSTDCEVEYLAALPTPAAEFPTLLSPGTYLVGIDIAPGTYRGEAGEDFLESCYWERLSGLSGSFGDLIANDNANGQFYVEVRASDYAFSTDCDLEFSGN